MVFVYLDSNSIDVTQKKWSCVKNVCKVQFQIVNLTEATQNIMYRVNAYDIETGSRYSGGSVKSLYDQREKVVIEANQSTQIEKTFRPNSSINNVNVTAWIIK